MFKLALLCMGSPSQTASVTRAQCITWGDGVTWVRKCSHSSVYYTRPQCIIPVFMIIPHLYLHFCKHVYLPDHSIQQYYSGGHNLYVHSQYISMRAEVAQIKSITFAYEMTQILDKKLLSVLIFHYLIFCKHRIFHYSVFSILKLNTMNLKQGHL